MQFVYSEYPPESLQQGPNQHVHSHVGNLGSPAMGQSPIAHANRGMSYVGTGGYIHARSPFVQGGQSSSMNVGSSSSHSVGQTVVPANDMHRQNETTPQSQAQEGLIRPSPFQPNHFGSPGSCAALKPGNPGLDGNHASVMVQSESGSLVGDRDNRIELWEESKRTRQRKLQRLAKTTFKENSRDWPIKVPTTAGG